MILKNLPLFRHSEFVATTEFTKDTAFIAIFQDLPPLYPWTVDTWRKSKIS